MTAVILDFYGTLVFDPLHSEGSPSVRTVVMQLTREAGLEVEVERIRSAVREYASVTSHAVADRESYEKWHDRQLRRMFERVTVDSRSARNLVDAFEAWRSRQLVPYPEALTVLGHLSSAGVRLGVCSNWGWDLEDDMQRSGVDPSIFLSTITSARVGWRKPHRRIFDLAAGHLAGDLDSTYFVGDSWDTDIRGALDAGFYGIHVWRPGERVGRTPKRLVPRTTRVGDLSGVTPVVLGGTSE